jgi:hypothetical protein
MILLVLQLGFETYSGYAYLVAGWGDKTLIAFPPQYLILEPFFDSVRKFGLKMFFICSNNEHHELVAFCVQNFYAWRIWAFQRDLLACLLCGVICTVRKIPLLSSSTYSISL